MYTAVGTTFVAQDTGRMLLNLRSNDVSYPHTWSFWGGKIEKGEIASTAAIRECLEETGLHISIERQVNKSFTDEGCLEIIFFLGSLHSSVNPEPYTPFKWLSRAELDLCTFPAANRDAVDWLRDFLLIN